MMQILPAKLIKELENLIKNKFVVNYHKIDNLGYLHGNVVIGQNGEEIIMDKAITVIKTQREMKVEDLFSTKEDQKDLKYIYELESQVMDYKKLKQSIDTIKGVLK